MSTLAKKTVPIKTVINPAKKARKNIPKKTLPKKKGKASKRFNFLSLRLIVGLILFFLLIASMLTTLFVIFFSVPNVHAGQKGRISIIIDDMGYDKKSGYELIKLPYNLSFAFLPDTPYSDFLQWEARANKKDILLHLALEPHSKTVSLEANTIKLDQTPSLQLKLFAENLRGVPYAIGVNNHMGSLFTEDSVAMERILLEVQKRDLFFIDSFTSKDSVAYSKAKSLLIPSIKRNIFLDNIRSEGAICEQLEKLANIAEKSGDALGIGHPYYQTKNALANCLPEISRRVEIVPVHQLVY